MDTLLTICVFMGMGAVMVFSAMARNAGSITDFFNIPPNRVVELGTRVEM